MHVHAHNQMSPAAYLAGAATAGPLARCTAVAGALRAFGMKPRAWPAPRRKTNAARRRMAILRCECGVVGDRLGLHVKPVGKDQVASLGGTATLLRGGVALCSSAARVSGRRSSSQLMQQPRPIRGDRLRHSVDSTVNPHMNLVDASVREAPCKGQKRERAVSKPIEEKERERQQQRSVRMSGGSVRRGWTLLCGRTGLAGGSIIRSDRLKQCSVSEFSRTLLTGFEGISVWPVG